MDKIHMESLDFEDNLEKWMSKRYKILKVIVVFIIDSNLITSFCFLAEDWSCHMNSMDVIKCVL